MNEEKSTGMEALRRESPPHKWLYDFMVEVLLSAGRGQTVSERCLNAD